MDSLTRALTGFGILVGGIVGGNELGAWLQWTSRRPRVYQMAVEAARRRKKPLLVVGRPRNRNHG